MVFFTCNHCGESVKKPSVEKHYNTKCRGAPKSISCMDCQKDFNDNYVEHVKCISELEKYSGKDFVPRENANKGAKKQEGWVETVRAVLESTEYELSKVTRQAFEMLQKYDNVPRKKAKFLNFVTNSVRIPRKTVEDVWSILEKEQEKLKQNKQKELEAAKVEKQPKENGEGQLEQNGHNKEDKKLGKKKKASLDEGAGENKVVDGGEKNNAEAQGEVDAKKKKKQKKKKNHDDGDTEAVTEETIEAEPATNGDVSAKKKKKHSDVEEANTNGTASDADENVSKKKQKKTSDSSEHQNGVEQDLDNTANKNNKKRAASNEETVEADTPKKKQKGSDESENQPQENGGKKNKKRPANNEESNEQETPKKKQKQNGESTKKAQKSIANFDEKAADEFSWDAELTAVMSKYADGIGIEKLKKKILKKYKTKFNEELNERQLHGFEKKFAKKLKKNQFTVEDDIVKSVS